MTKIPNPTTTNLPQFIAITGREGSGKDSYGEHLAALGYMHRAAGDVIRDEARRLGHKDPLPRSLLSKVGDDMKKRLGASPIVDTVLNLYNKNKEKYPSGLVISGIRRVGDLSAFKSEGAVVLWINADETRRFTNTNLRARDDHHDIHAFRERGEIEYNGDPKVKVDGVNIQAIEIMADCQVTNNSTLKSLFERGDKALSEVSKI